MKIFESANTLDGRDLFALSLGHRNPTGKDHFTVHQYSTGTTMTGRATLFGPG
jgi:hypothetical protein